MYLLSFMNQCRNNVILQQVCRVPLHLRRNKLLQGCLDFSWSGNADLEAELAASVAGAVRRAMASRHARDDIRDTSACPLPSFLCGAILLVHEKVQNKFQLVHLQHRKVSKTEPNICAKLPHLYIIWYQVLYT